MQCLNATTPLTNIYLTNQNFKDCDQSTNSEEKTKPLADNDGWITIPSHDPKKNKKNKGYKEKEKNNNSSSTIEKANINKRFQEFLIDARRSKNKCYDPSSLFKSISNMLKILLTLIIYLRFFIDSQGLGDMHNRMHKSFFVSF